MTHRHHHTSVVSRAQDAHLVHLRLHRVRLPLHPSPVHGVSRATGGGRASVRGVAFLPNRPQRAPNPRLLRRVRAVGGPLHSSGVARRVVSPLPSENAPTLLTPGVVVVSALVAPVRSVAASRSRALSSRSVVFCPLRVEFQRSSLLLSSACGVSDPRRSRRVRGESVLLLVHLEAHCCAVRLRRGVVRHHTTHPICLH